MTINLKPFEILRAPLSKTLLIEASAGTGKTYAVEGLFVRLIAMQHLAVEQILVVTFTNNAVLELKGRIHRKLLLAKDHLGGMPVTDAFIQDLAKETADPNAALEKINNALVNFDQAGIFTIHGFCQKILREHAFETRMVFSSEILSDTSVLIRQIALDFWRTHFYQAPLEQVSYAMAKLSGPEYFADLYARYWHSNALILPGHEVLSPPDIGEFRRSYRRTKEVWEKESASVMEKLQDPALDGRTYGSTKPPQIPGQLTKREAKTAGLAKDMADMFLQGRPVFPLCEGFELFTFHKITASTSKKKTPPVHDFFLVCEDLFAASQRLAFQMDQFLKGLAHDFFSYATSRLKKEKALRHVLGFDDLLIMVKDALAGPGGMALAMALQKKYLAVLVDEFQDTDPVQYEIFQTVFARNSHSLFLIGDPKQAIYGFRGADIFSYLHAVDQAQDAFTLLKNWRSTPDLITAVNTIFSNQASGFVFAQIPFYPVSPGNPSAAENHPEDHPEKQGTGPALILWHLFFESEEERPKPMAVETAVERISRAVALEIRELANDGVHPTPLEDIAVLVRTHRQASVVMGHLSAERIASVLYNSGNIFDTHEALELQRILRGLADPGNERKIKAALATDLLGAKAEDFETEGFTGPWEKRLSRMQGYAMIWKKSGFMPMARQMMREEKIKQRMGAYPDGERRLTNLLHLMELLHQADTEKKTGIQGLVKWLEENRGNPPRRSDEYLLRLEKDRYAVKIVTIHKSKGLEYPVVFCPFGWESSLVKEVPALEYHDPARDNALVVDLGSAQLEAGKKLACRERLAENLRLYYVALTRAKKKCYIAWGPIHTAETSAPAYLFHFNPDKEKTDADLVENLKATVSGKTQKDLLHDLKDLVRRSSNTICLTELPSGSETPKYQPPTFRRAFTHRRFTGTIDNSWKVTSYSALFSEEKSHDQAEDRDHLSFYSPLEMDVSEKEAVPETDFTSIHHFPKGARAGLFFHSLFENLDFTVTDRGIRIQCIDRKLAEYGFSPEWQPAIFQMVDQLLHTSLMKNREGLKLSALSNNNRINEMEFYYPIQPVTPRALKDLVYQAGGHPAGVERNFNFSPVQGFMRGFIDLIFFFGGKYYLLDWKSNFLGPSMADYGREALIKAMADHDYFLQYHIYALALHQYLSARIKGYDYNRDFGGIFYLFIRGVTPETGPDCGVFYDRPQPETMERLGDLLLVR